VKVRLHRDVVLEVPVTVTAEGGGEAAAVEKAAKKGRKAKAETPDVDAKRADAYTEPATEETPLNSFPQEENSLTYLTAFVSSNAVFCARLCQKNLIRNIHFKCCKPQSRTLSLDANLLSFLAIREFITLMAAFPEQRREQFLERPLPSSEESERAILGAILLDNQLIAQAVEHLKVEDFYSPLHRRIFGAMISLFESSKKIDPILIGEELKRDGAIESIGGVAAITNLTYGLPHFTDVADYINIVRGKSVMRSLIRTCNEITSEALEEDKDPITVLDQAEQSIFELTELEERKGFEKIQPIADQVFIKIKDYATNHAHALTGLATGFRDLDQLTSGLQQGDLIIVAARPSMERPRFALISRSVPPLTNGQLSPYFPSKCRRNSLLSACSARRLRSMRENCEPAFFRTTIGHDSRNRLALLRIHDYSSTIPPGSRFLRCVRNCVGFLPKKNASIW
jgi:hypothetical protein